MELVTVDDIRQYLLDRGPNDNFLLDDVEFSDETILKAMEFTVDLFNSTLPRVISYTLETFPHRAELIQGAAAYCLRAAAINLTRNDLKTTTQGGTQIRYSDPQAYLGLAREISENLRDQFKQLKVNVNVESCYGIIH